MYVSTDRLWTRICMSPSAYAITVNRYLLSCWWLLNISPESFRVKRTQVDLNWYTGSRPLWRQIALTVHGSSRVRQVLEEMEQPNKRGALRSRESSLARVPAFFCFGQSSAPWLVFTRRELVAIVAAAQIQYIKQKYSRGRYKNKAGLPNLMLLYSSRIMTRSYVFFIDGKKNDHLCLLG